MDSSLKNLQKLEQDIKEGTKLPKFNNKPNHFIKDKNGKARWISRSLAVVVVVLLNDDKVLLVKRGKRVTSTGKWCNPCGYLDWDESATQCAVREVWEETGLDLTEYMGDTTKVSFNGLNTPWDLVTNPNLNYKQDVALYFGISLKLDEEPVLTTVNCEIDESDDAKWVKISELNDYTLAFNHDKRINKFLEYIKNGK